MLVGPDALPLNACASTLLSKHGHVDGSIGADFDWPVQSADLVWLACNCRRDLRLCPLDQAYGFICPLRVVGAEVASRYRA